MTAVSPLVTHLRYCSLALSHPCHLSHQFHISKRVLVNKMLMINQKQISESSPDMSWKQTQQTHITQAIVKVNIKQLTIQCKQEYKICGPLIAECASQSGQDDKATSSLALTMGSSGNRNESVNPISTASLWWHDYIADSPWNINSTSW